MVEATCINLCPGEESYARNESGELVLIRVLSVAFWTIPFLELIKAILPLRFRGVLAQWALDHGIRYEVIG